MKKRNVITMALALISGPIGAFLPQLFARFFPSKDTDPVMVSIFFGSLVVGLAIAIWALVRSIRDLKASTENATRLASMASIVFSGGNVLWLGLPTVYLLFAAVTSLSR